MVIFFPDNKQCKKSSSCNANDGHVKKNNAGKIQHRLVRVGARRQMLCVGKHYNPRQNVGEA